MALVVRSEQFDVHRQWEEGERVYKDSLAVMTFEITFFGHTASGMRVASETSSGILLFRFAGSTPLSRSVR